MEPPEIEWFSKKEKDQKIPLTSYISELENGLFLIISEKGARLGTIALGIPTFLSRDKVNTSSMPIVFGIRNDLLTRAIAERVAFICKKIVIVSTYLIGDSSELAQRALRFAEESIQDFQSKK